MRLLWIVLAAVAAIVVIGGGLWAWSTSQAADVGAAAMAKVACSCVFVEGRTLEACRADDVPGFEGVDVVLDETAKTATGSVMGLIKRTATFKDGYGCELQP